jgi:hypothetical protein
VLTSEQKSWCEASHRLRVKIVVSPIKSFNPIGKCGFRLDCYIQILAYVCVLRYHPGPSTLRHDQGLLCWYVHSSAHAHLRRTRTAYTKPPDVCMEDQGENVITLILILWSSGQSSRLLTQRFWVRFPSLPHFLSSSGSGTRSTQPREDK